MDVFVFCLKCFDQNKEVQVHEKGLKKLIRISDLGLLWHVAWFFAPGKNPHRNCSGLYDVYDITTAAYEPASAKFLTIIDLSVLDKICIFSTFFFMIEEGKKFNTPSTCITFNQSLWEKTMGITKEKTFK